MLNIVNLPEDLQAFAEECIRKGQNASVEEVICDALKEKRHETVMKEIAESGISYTWNQAIRDGLFVDVTPLAKAAGFGIPVALTLTVRARLEPSERDARLGQSFEGRLKDVVTSLGAHSPDLDPVLFDVDLIESAKQQTIHLKALIGLDENSKPVVTIMFEHEG